MRAIHAPDISKLLVARVVPNTSSFWNSIFNMAKDEAVSPKMCTGQEKGLPPSLMYLFSHHIPDNGIN
jgi:hypothetical protein